MGNRLSKIATRTGDAGMTGLGDGSRVEKDHLRICAMGDVDELNSHIGLLLCEDMPRDVRELLIDVQHQLFNLGGELSIPGFELLKDEAVLALDEALENYNAQLPKLEEFILPAGTRGAHAVARCVPQGRRKDAGQGGGAQPAEAALHDGVRLPGPMRFARRAHRLGPVLY